MAVILLDGLIYLQSSPWLSGSRLHQEVVPFIPHSAPSWPHSHPPLHLQLSEPTPQL